MVKNKHNVDVVVDDDKWSELITVDSDECAKLIDVLCDYLAENKVAVKYDLHLQNKPFDVVLALSNSDEVRKLNADFRSKDAPTNVLSFANIDADDFADMLAGEENIALGDIIMSWQVLEEEAKEKNITLADHFWHLFLHGVLHLMGFDHQQDDDAEVMEAIEIAVLKLMNIENPYRE